MSLNKSRCWYSNKSKVFKVRCSSVTMTSLKSQDKPTASLIEAKNWALSLTRWHWNFQVKVVAFLNYYNFFKEKKALAFNLDRCCHLALCLQLIHFHYRIPRLYLMYFWKNRLSKCGDFVSSYTYNLKTTFPSFPSSFFQSCFKQRLDIPLFFNHPTKNINYNIKKRLESRINPSLLLKYFW
jgi:hypothetical protein